jgi:hypothetical protein
MSVLTGRGHLTPVQADAYGAALLQLLGTRNPLEVLRSTPAALRRRLYAGHDLAHLRQLQRIRGVVTGK